MVAKSRRVYGGSVIYRSVEQQVLKIENGPGSENREPSMR